jgi:hypothetical protein
VLDLASLLGQPAQECIAIQNQTPLVNENALSAEFQARAGGYNITILRNLDRIAIEWAAEAKSLGFIKGGEKVGIIGDACVPRVTVLNNVLKPGIEAIGAGSVTLYTHDCSTQSAQSQAPALVTRMCLDGVTHIFFAIGPVGGINFLTSADASPCGKGPNRWRYFASDWFGNSYDSVARLYPPTQWDGVIAITNGYTGWQAAGKPNPERMDFCAQIVADAGLPPLTNDYTNTEAIFYCDAFFLFVQVATNTGADLTRANWVTQVQAVGRVDHAIAPYSIYGPGKFSGSELVQTEQFNASCSCYISISDFREAPG